MSADLHSFFFWCAASRHELSCQFLANPMAMQDQRHKKICLVAFTISSAVCSTNDPVALTVSIGISISALIDCFDTRKIF